MKWDFGILHIFAAEMLIVSNEPKIDHIARFVIEFVLYGFNSSDIFKSLDWNYSFCEFSFKSGIT